MLLIKNGTVVDPGRGLFKPMWIWVDQGRIQKISDVTEISAGVEGYDAIDAAGCIVAPGLVDVHVHFRDPGLTYKEDIGTGAAAALRGGFTSVVLMANTKPPVDDVDILRYVIEKGQATKLHVHTCATVTKGMAGKELVDMDALLAHGAAGFTDDGVPVMDAQLLEQAMRKTAALKVPISLHEEDPGLIAENGIHHGRASEHFGISGSPREAEISMIRRDLEIALRTGAILNIQHISTKEGVELVRDAKKKAAASGMDNIHAEATPHHFSLTQEATVRYGALAKMNPPLREEADKLAVIQGLADGTIDLIATDHAPHSAEEKARPITEAPSGIIGLETALPLGMTELVKKGHLSVSRLIECMSTSPARLYGLDAGTLAEGAPADIVIFDPDASQAAGGYASKSANTPFTGRLLQGVVRYTIVDGKIAYRNVR